MKYAQEEKRPIQKDPRRKSIFHRALLRTMLHVSPTVSERWRWTS